MAAPPTPTIGLPRPDEALTWALRLAGEVARIPTTLYRVRVLLHELSRLPEQIDELIAALDRTTVRIEGSIDPMAEALGDLRGIVGGVDDKLDPLGQSVLELTGTITNLVGSIPGARRALRPAR